MKKIVLIAGLLLSAGAYAQKDTAFSYRPELHGTFRSKYEYQTGERKGRFEVRNARTSIEGKVLPYVSYKAEIDLSDEGSIKMLDAYGRLELVKALSLTAGQMRVPFTIDAHRSPHKQFFANRSFIAKQVGNVRDVGAMVSWKPSDAPIVVEGGLFNGSGLTNQKNYWTGRLNYSAKLQAFLPGGLTLEGSVQQIRPDSVAEHLWNVGATWQVGRLTLEAEYLRKYYAHDAFSAVDAFDAIVRYRIPFRSTALSLLTRFDFMDKQSDGVSDEKTGRLTTTDAARQRLTLGTTWHLSHPLTAEVRANFEKYWYHGEGTPKISERDKAVLELMIHF